MRHKPTYISSFPPKKQLPLMPGILVAYTGPGEPSQYYYEIEDTVVIGRGEKSLILPDTGISRRHIRITRQATTCSIEDLGSKNGTSLNGRRLTAERRLPNQSIIALGNTLFVYLDDIRNFRITKEQPTWGMAGRFYTRKLTRDLTALALSPNQGILLAGPQGAGKTAAANTVAEMLGREIFSQRASEYDTESAILTALIGVREHISSDVVECPGYIDMADSGILFITDAHRIPRSVQDRLIPLLDDGTFLPIGAATPKKVDLRLILASSEPGPTHGITLDMLSRLKVIKIPPLSERIADIPSLFEGLLREALYHLGLPATPVIQHFDASHYLTLMGHRFKKNNVYGLKAVVDSVARDIEREVLPGPAIKRALSNLKSGLSTAPPQSRFDEVTRKVSMVTADLDADGDSE